jgi:hypothetical protein
MLLIVLAIVLQKALRKAHIWPGGGGKYAVGHIVAAIEYEFGWGNAISSRT